MWTFTIQDGLQIFWIGHPPLPKNAYPETNSKFAPWKEAGPRPKKEISSAPT